MYKKRLGIFVIYNAQQRVEDYVLYLLDNMYGLFSNLIIVVNGKLNHGEVDKLRIYSQNIIFRNNYGFDAGAYKEVITKHLATDGMEDFDQCVLFNDTFCGSFYDWNDIFLRMGKEKKDFWGLSKWIGGYSQLLDENLPEHVQAFFLVIEKDLLRSELFMKFWHEMQVPKFYEDAIKKFEVGFTQYFYKKGFQYLTWLDVTGAKSLLHMNDVVYLSYAGELIDTYSFPVLKKKACTVTNLEQIIRVDRYLKQECIDDGGIIRGMIDSELKKSEYFSIEDMQSFYDKHTKVYVYGNGKYANLLKLYVEFKQWRIEAVIVTERKPGEEVLEYKDIIFGEDDGVIIAVGERCYREIYDNICRDWKGLDILPFRRQT